MANPRITSLSWVFTYASNPVTGTTSLLFTNLKDMSLENRRELYSRETIQGIVNDPLYQTLMGTSSIITPATDSSDRPILLATTDVSEYVAPLLACATGDEHVAVVSGQELVAWWNLKEVYYGCTRPQKLIYGCVHCINSTSDKLGNCPIRQVTVNSRLDTEEHPDPGELSTTLKSRKSKIKDFVYISPVLTALEHFSKTVRDPTEHDFRLVTVNAYAREEIVNTRATVQKNIKNGCSQCFVREACHTNHDHTGRRRKLKHCNTVYTGTEEEAYTDILQRSPMPMTPKQMYTLLANSGELTKRFNRKICYATFRIPYRYEASYTPLRLEFQIISRCGREVMHTCKDYDDAVEILTKYNGAVGFLNTDDEMSVRMYALLYELAGHRQSPCSRGAWHQTVYPQLCLTRGPYGVGVEVTYTYNDSNQSVLPWSLRARTLNDIYVHYDHFTSYTAKRSMDQM